MMILAALLSMVFTTAGLAISYPLRLQVGATTIILAGSAYLLTLLFVSLTRRTRA
jgi:zinc transport system permease protein